MKGENLKHKVGAHATTFCPSEGALLKLLLIALRGIDAGFTASAESCLFRLDVILKLLRIALQGIDAVYTETRTFSTNQILPCVNQIAGFSIYITV